MFFFYLNRAVNHRLRSPSLSNALFLPFSRHKFFFCLAFRDRVLFWSTACCWWSNLDITVLTIPYKRFF